MSFKSPLSLLSPDDEGQVRPRYGQRCLSDLPDAIFNHLGLPCRGSELVDVFLASGVKPESCQNVILLLVDGLGFLQSLEWTFLAKLRMAGSIAPITTVFPSTTAAALTTLHSGGMTPQEHGLPEWYVYFEEEGAILETLPFRNLRNGLSCRGNPAILFDGTTMYEKLQKEGIRSFVFLRSSYEDGAYSRTVLRGSTVVGFVDAADLFVNLATHLFNAKSPTYFFVYWDAVDAMAHKYGPNNAYSQFGLEVLGYALKRGMLDRLDRVVARNTLLLITGDHGGIRVRPDKTTYLEREWPKISRVFRHGPNNEAILPTGNVRDVFLSVQNDKIRTVIKTLRRLLGDRAKVLSSENAVKNGLFGSGTIHARFRSRIGDVLILPHGAETAWFRHPGTRPFGLSGVHGGLSPQEMVVPLAVTRLSAIS